MKKVGAVLILFGLFVIIASFPFTEGYSPGLGVLGSISHMKLVLKEGQRAQTFYNGAWIPYGDYYGRVTVPYRYVVTAGITLVFAGCLVLVLIRGRAKRVK